MLYIPYCLLSGYLIPPHLEKECLFIVKHNLLLRTVIGYTPNANHYWGQPGLGIRQRLSRYIQKLKRDKKQKPSTNILIQQVTSADAPISSEALEKIERSMTTDDYEYDPGDDDEEEENYDVNRLAGSMGSLSVGPRTPRRSTMSPTGRGNPPRGGGEVGSLRGSGRGAGGVPP